MLAIKFKRIGKKHQPAYRLVVAEKRSKLRGRYVEDLGWFNPLEDSHVFNKERLQYWLGVGAQPTDAVHNLLVNDGVISAPKRAVHKRNALPKPEVQEAPVAAEAPETKAESPAPAEPEASPVEKPKEAEPESEAVAPEAGAEVKSES